MAVIRRTPRFLAITALLAAIALVVVSQVIGGTGSRVALYSAAALLGGFAGLTSRSITTIVFDALRHPTVHTRIVGEGDALQVRDLDHGGRVTGGVH
ncbi:MAG: hypothetical protein ACRD4E_03425 [Bryobacteraceae bacterium]